MFAFPSFQQPLCMRCDATELPFSHAPSTVPPFCAFLASRKPPAVAAFASVVSLTVPLFLIQSNFFVGLAEDAVTRFFAPFVFLLSRTTTMGVRLSHRGGPSHPPVGSSSVSLSGAPLVAHWPPGAVSLGCDHPAQGWASWCWRCGSVSAAAAAAAADSG